MSEPAIIFLPYGPEPDHLTAYIRPQTLREHLAAFLAANNATGFASDEMTSIDLNKVGDLLVSISERDRLSEKFFKDFAKKLRKASQDGICHGRALEIISFLFGYASWREARITMTKDGGGIENSRRRHLGSMDIFDVQSRHEG